MSMKNPPHPGLSIKLDCLEPLDLSVTEGAKALGVTRQALSNVINGKAGISAEMATRLSQAFGGTAEVWLRMQIAYDLAQVQQKNTHVRVFRPHILQGVAGDVAAQHGTKGNILSDIWCRGSTAAIGAQESGVTLLI